MIDQPLGQRRRQHQLALGDGNKTIAQAVEPELGTAGFRDPPIEMMRVLDMARGAGRGGEHPVPTVGGQILGLGLTALEDGAQLPGDGKLQGNAGLCCLDPKYIERRENVIALGNSGTGKTHIALGLGLAACQKGLTVGFITAAALVHELIEARDEKRLLRFQKQLAKYKLLIIDELGFVPLSKTGAELLFEVFSQRYEGGSTLVTSNLPFDEWTEVFGSERLTGALLDRLTHHVHILEMNGDSYRLNQSQKRRKPPKT